MNPDDLGAVIERALASDRPSIIRTLARLIDAGVPKETILACVQRTSPLINVVTATIDYLIERGQA